MDVRANWKFVVMIKDIVIVASLVAVIFVGISGCAYVFQRRLTYFPDRSPPDLAAPFATVSYVSRDGLAMTSWYAPPTEPGAAVIVYFHGNGGHAGYRADKMSPYLDDGLGVLLVGYRGYGGNPGSPSESGLYLDAEAAITWLATETIADDRTVLYGESLGTAIAVEMAMRHSVKAIVLEAPFTSLADVGARAYPFLPVRWLARDRYETIAKIGDVSAPVMVIHGEQDQIVPADMGRAVLAAAPDPKRGLFVQGFGHNEMIAVGAPVEVLNWLDGLSD
jgi:hypothetical protein